METAKDEGFDKDRVFSISYLQWSEFRPVNNGNGKR
jgi:hypothetical protein